MYRAETGASHEASNSVRNRSRYPSHCCNQHAVVAVTFDRASCRRYSHRSLQEFPQPDRRKGFRTIALLSGTRRDDPRRHRGDRWRGEALCVNRFTLANWPPVVFSWDAWVRNSICYLRGALGDAGAAAASLGVATYCPHAGRQRALTPKSKDVTDANRRNIFGAIFRGFCRSWVRPRSRPS
jgi:hypothetical protein